MKADKFDDIVKARADGQGGVMREQEKIRDDLNKALMEAMETVVRLRRERDEARDELSLVKTALKVARQGQDEITEDACEMITELVAKLNNANAMLAECIKPLGQLAALEQLTGSKKKADRYVDLQARILAKRKGK